MNFSKKPAKDYKPKNQPLSEKFQNSSGLFMQLGLVLAMFMVYVTLEYASPKDLTMHQVYETNIDPIYEFPVPNAFVVEQKKAPVKQVKQKAMPIDQIVAVDDALPTPEDIFEPIDSDEPVPTIADLVHDDGPSDPDEDLAPVPFFILEDAPIFPGCEDLDREASKACFSKAMTKFINKNFRAGTADGLNLEGRQRIVTMFTINTEGLVDDIQIRAPHKRLESEARRVVEKLPKMIPGMQRKRPVAVKYTLPIVFDIQ